VSVSGVRKTTWVEEGAWLLGMCLLGCGPGALAANGAPRLPGGAATTEPEDRGPGPCPLLPRCGSAALPPLGTRASFRHRRSRFAARLGAAHRGRDQLVREGEVAYAMAKFAYGPSDKDLEDEDVEVFLQPHCGGPATLVGTVATSAEKGEAEGSTSLTAVDEAALGASPGHGRVTLSLGTLPRGRHRVVFVVRGDGSRTEATIDVLPATAKIVVTDIDGTQTGSEYEEVTALLQGRQPSAQPGGAALLRALALRGYVPFYLTARPEQLTERTRRFLAENGYPPGPLHTTRGLGALHGAAAAFKIAELGDLRASGLRPTVLLGNRPSDGVAFTSSVVLPADPAEKPPECWLLQLDDATGRCRRIESWAEIVKEADEIPPSCSAEGH
jgi:hypothetical protein